MNCADKLQGDSFAEDLVDPVEKRGRDICAEKPAMRQRRGEGDKGAVLTGRAAAIRGVVLYPGVLLGGGQGGEDTEILRSITSASKHSRRRVRGSSRFRSRVRGKDHPDRHPFLYHGRYWRSHKFFPVVYRRTNDANLNSNYCKYDNQGLQLFTSSLYLAGLTATFFASYTTRKLERSLTMLMAGVFFLVGVAFNAAAQDLAMLIIGRILLGVPALLLFFGTLLVTDTPNSLIERGKLEEGRAVLRKIRGSDNIEPEFLERVEASRVAKLVKHPFRNPLQRRNRPQLVIATVLKFFQQFTGINAIMFYAPVIFNTLGFGGNASLYSAVVKDHSDNLAHGYAIFVVVMVCTFVSSFAWSWGPLGWLIPSESFPLETRSAGQSVT
ncbi:Sugar transport protein MST4-like protein, partial [Drosera capensis]